MNRNELEDYLGITDNENRSYKNAVIADYRNIKKLYPNCEYALTEDLGLYIEYDEIVASGKYITAFR